MEGQFIDAKETVIMMSDGGSDGEAVPIQPLLVKARGLDTIFAIDSVSTNLGESTSSLNNFPLEPRLVQ